jgi:hypothetical protein
MFHFRCATCGAAPGETPLRTYLEGWRTAAPIQVQAIAATIGGALQEVGSAKTPWITKKFRRAADDAIGVLAAVAGSVPLDAHLTAAGRRLRFDITCPMCWLPAGERRRDNYFTTWDDACKVQTGNLLYESALVFWAVLTALPPWANAIALRQLDALRMRLHEAGRAMSNFLECPQCGRFTSSLYGSDVATGFCRWCLDAGGGMSITLSVEEDSDGAPSVRVSTSDPYAAARNVWDCLPPEVTERIAEGT